MQLRAKPQDFIRIYEEKLPTSNTYKEAYEKAEAEHQKLCGSRMYSDHGSFRVIYNRTYKRKKKA